MRLFIVFTVVLLLVSAMFGLAVACTVFVLDDGSRHYYGSNYDWHLGIGYVLVNPSGLAKQAWPKPEDPGRPLQWQSKYGSLTFVQYGQGLPKGGMNEAGLAIEGLMLHATEYPQPDDRPYIGSTGHFKQYLLDTCATVAEVIDRLSRIRVAITDWAPGIHFMVADAAGGCAVIEFLDGRLVIHRGDDLPVKVLTNHPYAKTLPPQAGQYDAGLSFTTSTRRRYKIATDRLAVFGPVSPEKAVAYAMDTLQAVSAGSYTQWRVVYDQSSRVVYWRCSPEQTLRWIDLKQIDFDCNKPVAGLAVQRNLSGEVNDQLTPFSIEDNRKLVYQVLERSRDIIGVPKTIWDEIWRWPAKENCINN